METVNGYDNGELSSVEYVKLSDENGVQKHPSALEVSSASAPWFVWPVYVAAILAGSASGPVTKSMHGVEPFALAGWRHQVTALALLPGFVWQWTHFSKSDRQRFRHPSTLGFLFVSALGLSAHAGSYIWSLDHTSMTHCLFLTALSPIIVVMHTKLFGGTLLPGEVGGVLLGLLGAAILAAGTRVEVDNEATLVGDLAACFSAACMAIYLTAGRKLRSWMPLFLYQFPITVAASLLLAGAASIPQDMTWSGSDGRLCGQINEPFSWISNEYLFGTLFLGLVAGVVGHGGSSAVLRYVSPLFVTAGLSLQPILGSVLGWAMGESGVPGKWTCLGGLVSLSGTVCVSYASEFHKVKSETKSDQSRDVYRLLAGDGEEYQGTRPFQQDSEIL